MKTLKQTLTKGPYLFLHFFQSCPLIILMKLSVALATNSFLWFKWKNEGCLEFSNTQRYKLITNEHYIVAIF